MRNAMLTVVGIVGLVLLCGSAELLAQNTPTGNTSGAGTSTGTAGGTGTVATGADQTTRGAGGDLVGLPQSVMELQQQVAQVRQDVAQLRSEVERLNANMAVGGSGQAGVDANSPQGNPLQDTEGSATGGSGTQSTAGGTPPGTPLRAGTAAETGASSAPSSGEAVVTAIYTGTVRSVSSGRLILRDEDGKDFTVQLGDKTRVLRNGQRISAQELKQGTRVRATVDMLSGHNQATEVRTLPVQ
ncbi:hypothetical protein [Hyalangium versicolor]|uniref:hypothetical protein n=1 Tax=Hyalangium versicolor TaxID=2861190 RepID=UPI001CCDE7E0|nr:hypothetical protein [Hyalangium versicolor]